MNSVKIEDVFREKATNEGILKKFLKNFVTFCRMKHYILRKAIFTVWFSVIIIW